MTKYEYRVLVALAVAQSAGPIAAQPAAGSGPKFEVASIKRCTMPDDAAAGAVNDGGRGQGAPAPDPGRYRVECRTVEDLIRTAYIWYATGEAGRIPPTSQNQPIQGTPAWTRSERYTINAKSEAPQTKAMMAGPMMLALIEERFQLKIHRESKEVPAYALVVARGGPKLQPTKGCVTGQPGGPPPPVVAGQPPPCGYQSFTEEGMDTFGSTMAELCRRLGNKLGREVVDKTEISGAFDLHLAGFSFPPPPGAPRDADSPDPLEIVASALQKLGLKLESAKSSAEFLVVDHVERPSEN
jgi:uncharacterized protein (TIGR03435 family)